MGLAAVQQHHHRSNTKVSHRPFKSKHATKGTLKDLAKGKVEKSFGPNAKSRHQQVMSKIDRKHQARQKQQAKRKEHIQNTSIFNGQNGAPRIVAVVPVGRDADAVAAIQKINQSLDVDANVSAEVPSVVDIDRFRQRVQYIPCSRHLMVALDACRVADFVLFVLSAQTETDPQAELLLRSIESQGISSVLTVVQGLDTIQPAKKKTQIVGSLKAYISHYFPAQEKVHSLDASQECLNVIRTLCTATPKGIRWREDRSWMLVDEVRWDGKSQDREAGPLVIRGVVRGRGLKANRLLQLADYGAFQIEKIIPAPEPHGRKRKAEELVIEEMQEILEAPDEDQDDLAELAPEEVAMEDADMPISEAPTERRGVLLDDHHYFSDDEPQPLPRPRRIPKGTSDYQAAWYLDDLSDSGSDLESLDGEDNGGVDLDQANPEDGLEGLADATMRDPTEAAASEYPESEMFVDRSLEEEVDEIAAYRKSKRTESEDDLEFPDEIELHPNVLARERLARYRGLKSLRTSEWDVSEDRGHEPEDWKRLLQIPDYRGAKSKVIREALVGGVQPGTRVDVHLRNVPQSLKASIQSNRYLCAFSLLRHEKKRAVSNYTISLASDYPVPIKSKEEIIAQCGPRRFIINPLFSGTGVTPNNVHKFDRFLHPGQTAMATFTGPVTWGAVPVVYFKQAKTLDGASEGPIELVGTGTAQAPDQARVIAKRVILTGHPYKIHKKVVTVRYMFFNKDDVRWFKALQLWTKRGRSGFVKESLGTHGYFKANFDAKINQQDSVGVSLYKRVFPRPAREWVRSGGVPALVASDGSGGGASEMATD